MNGHAPMLILFNKTRQQCRLLGARGGRTHARNLRLRKLQSRLPIQPVAPVLQIRPETVHEASLSLDRQFPWLAVAFPPRTYPSRHTLRRESNLALALDSLGVLRENVSTPTV